MVRKSNIIRRRLGHNSLAVNRSSVWPLLWVESFTNWVRLKQSNSTKQSLVIVELVWSVCVLKYPRISILLNTTKTINCQIQTLNGVCWNDSKLQGRDTQNNKTFKGRKHWFRHSADANFQWYTRESRTIKQSVPRGVIVLETKSIILFMPKVQVVVCNKIRQVRHLIIHRSYVKQNCVEKGLEVTEDGDLESKQGSDDRFSLD